MKPFICFIGVKFLPRQTGFYFLFIRGFEEDKRSEFNRDHPNHPNRQHKTISHKMQRINTKFTYDIFIQKAQIVLKCPIQSAI
jgi:hypothetical protein